MRQRFFWNVGLDKPPKNYDDVLATVEVSPDERVVVQAYYVNGTFYDATFNTELQDVVAWMISPQPYEEKDEAEERTWTKKKKRK